MNLIPNRLISHFAAVLLVCVFSAVTFAQDKEWRPVSPAELSAKQPIVEPNADAEAIFWEVRIDDSSYDDLSLRHYVRVKIFTERGREKFSKFDIPFTKDMRIKDLAARVTRADGTTVEIDKKDIFEREIIKADGVKIKAKSFAVPNIEPGVIVEYRYREAINDAGAKGMRLAFQRDIPVQEMSYYYKPFGKQDPNYQNYNFTDTKFVKDDKGFWLARRKNVPSFKEEPRMPPDDMVRPWMLLTGTRLGITGAGPFSISFTVKDPSSPQLYWGGVAAERMPLVKFITKPNKEITRVATELTAGETTQEGKLRKLYEFAQREIRNTTFDTTLTDEERAKLPKVGSLEDILKRRQGDSQYVDMLFGAMASALKMPVRVAFVGNNSKMFFKPEMTNENLIHPGAIAVQVGQDWQFFNPGLKFLPFGMLVWYEEQNPSLILGEKQYSWSDTPMTPHDRSAAKRTGKLKLLDDGTLEGRVKIELTGHLALNYRLDNYDESPEKRIENLKAEIKERIASAEVSNINIENLDDISKPVVHQFDIRVPNYAQKTGKRLFVQPGFFEYGERSLFASAERKYDVYFRFPWSEKDDIEIELPKGFELDNADTPAATADRQGIGSAAYSIKHRTEAVSAALLYERKFHFGGGNIVLFPSQSFPALKNMFDAFHKSDSHTITLRQK